MLKVDVVILSIVFLSFLFFLLRGVKSMMNIGQSRWVILAVAEEKKQSEREREREKESEREGERR